MHVLPEEGNGTVGEEACLCSCFMGSPRKKHPRRYDSQNKKGNNNGTEGNRH